MSIPGVCFDVLNYPRPTIVYKLEEDLKLILWYYMVESSPFHEKFIYKLDHMINELLYTYHVTQSHIQFKINYFIRITDYSECNFNFILMVRHEKIDLRTMKKESEAFNIQYQQL